MNKKILLFNRSTNLGLNWLNPITFRYILFIQKVKEKKKHPYPRSQVAF